MRKAIGHSSYRHCRKALLEAARGLLWKCQTNGPPYDPNLLARELQVDVKEAWLDGVEGYVEKQDEKWVATVSSRSIPTRRRFTLTHELGHVFLMRQGLDSYLPQLQRFRGKAFSPKEESDPLEEALCNAFAEEFLLPTRETNQRLGNGSVDPKTIFSIANEFNVSIQMAATKVARTLGRRKIGCSMWRVQGLWPMPLWWAGLRTQSRRDTENLERLVAKSMSENYVTELWHSFDGKAGRFKLKIAATPQRRYALLLVEKVCKPPSAEIPGSWRNQLAMSG